VTTFISKMHHLTLISCWTPVSTRHILNNFIKSRPTTTKVPPYDRADFSRSNGIVHLMCRPPWAGQIGPKVCIKTFSTTTQRRDVRQTCNQYHLTDLVEGFCMIYSFGGGTQDWCVPPAVSSRVRRESYPRPRRSYPRHEHFPPDEKLRFPHQSGHSDHRKPHLLCTIFL